MSHKEGGCGSRIIIKFYFLYILRNLFISRRHYLQTLSQVDPRRHLLGPQALYELCHAGNVQRCPKDREVRGTVLGSRHVHAA